MNIALVVPHIFMHEEILPLVIFSPGYLVLDLANGLANNYQDKINITLFTPGSVKKYITNSNVKNINADLSNFEKELSLRKYRYITLLKKHPLIFSSLARQVQAELIKNAFERANNDEFDLVHIYTNEEELALVFQEFCKKKVIFNHHEPFNFLAKYRAIFPKYTNLNWISFSFSQRSSMPKHTNWIANIYHGLKKEQFLFKNDNFKKINKSNNNKSNKKEDYIAFMGRIIEPKGVDLAIQACKKANIKLKIAGKHYSSNKKDQYWEKYIKNELKHELIEYVGFLKTTKEKEKFLKNAKALIMPSIWQEPFGMVMIEALACGTPVIGFNNGAIPEIIKNGKVGLIVKYQAEKDFDKNQKKFYRRANINALKNAILNIDKIDRNVCRQEFEKRFTQERMCKNYFDLYQKVIKEKK